MSARQTVRALRLSALAVLVVIGAYAIAHELWQLLAGVAFGFLVTFLLALAASVEQHERQRYAERHRG